MGMTIDEAIRRIDEHNYIHQNKEPRAVYITEAFDVAVETMRKYQKIEETINKWCAENTWEFDTFYLYEIRGIIEDGID